MTISTLKTTKELLFPLQTYVTVKILMLDSAKSHNLQLPSQMTPHSAALDLRSVEAVEIAPGQTRVVKTGLKLEIPAGWEGQVRSRSGLAAKSQVFVMNSPGTIDADYRGEIMVILTNLSATSFKVEPGDRIAQISFHQVPIVYFDHVSELSDTTRGEGGLGSTGVK